MEPHSASTDADLLAAWSRGRCEASFRGLVARYLGLVRGLAMRRTGDAALADEIAQNVFTRLAARAGRIDAVPTLAPWLHHCAYCETTSALRRESSRRRHMNDLLTLMNAKTKTALVTAACMALPLIWQWQRASGMEARLVAANKDSAALKGRLSIAQAQQSGPLGKGNQAAADAGANLSGRAAGSAADWEVALKDADPLQRSQRLAALMVSLTADSAPGVAEMFKRLRSGDNGSQYELDHRNFFRAWGRRDGQAALGFYFGTGGINASAEALSTLAGWAQTSPDKARAWLDSQTDGDAKTGLALGLIDGWALADFDAASTYATSLPRSTSRDQFRSLLLQRALAAGGVPEAQRWFDGIPGDNHNTLYKQRAFDELIGAMMQRDPGAAAEWITRIGRQPFMSGDGLPEVAGRLAQSSPGEALRWLEKLGTASGDASQSPAKGYASVMNVWSQKDSAAAGTWLQSHPEHPAYDQMAAAHAQSVASQDGATALAWADSIQNEDLRREARDNAARAMLRAKGDDAHSALAAAGYTDEQIKELNGRHGYAAAFLNQAISITSDQLISDQLASRNYTMAIHEAQTALRANDAQVETRTSARLWLDARGTLPPVLPSDVTARDAGFSRAHGGSAPSGKCADCHR